MTRIPLISLVTALAIGAHVANSAVPPTPGPVVVAENTGSNMGLFILYSIIVAIPTVYVVGILYGRWIGNKNNYVASEIPDENELEERYNPNKGNELNKEVPLSLAFGLIALPVILILLHTTFDLAFPELAITSFFAFIGETEIALLITVLLGSMLLGPYISKPKDEVYNAAFKSAGLIILITGAGGAFGNVVEETGIGDHIVKLLMAWQLPILFLVFLLALFFRVSLGSGTVALITASSILGPMVDDLSISPILLGLSICAGSLGLAMPNDSGFWVISKFGGLSVTNTLKVYSFGGLLAGVVMIICIYILRLGSSFLPGL